MCEQSFSAFPQDQGRIPSGPYPPPPQGLYPQYNTEKWSKSECILFSNEILADYTDASRKKQRNSRANLLAKLV